MKSFFFWSGCIILFLCQCSSSAHLTTFGGIGKDKSLYYYHTGKGEPVIIVHGGPGLNHSYFLPYLDRLSSSFHLVYYDQKACGQAEIPADTSAMRLSPYIEDIETVRLKFGFKKFHLLAHSWGTMLAAQYALKYPDHLKSLILVNPAAFSSADVKEASRILNGRFDYTDQLARTQIIESAEFRIGSHVAMEKLFKLGFRQNMAKKDLADSIRLRIPEDYAKRNGSLKYLYRDLYDYDLYPALKKISAPTLIIEGDQDAGLGATEKIRVQLPAAQYELIREAGHFPFIEQPLVFESAIKKFIADLTK